MSLYLQGSSGSMSQVVRLPNNSYKPITNTAWLRTHFVNYKKGALDSQPQVITFTSCLPMVGDSPASSTTRTCHHDIAEIMLKLALNTKNQIKSITCTSLYLLALVCHQSTGLVQRALWAIVIYFRLSFITISERTGYTESFLNQLYPMLLWWPWSDRTLWGINITLRLSFVNIFERTGLHLF